MLRYMRRLAIARSDRGIVEVRRQGLRWQLDLTQYLDRAIYVKGRFEHRATRLVDKLVGKGMRVLDVGANFGYYTTILGDRVGPSGKVWAFEPTDHFGRRIAWHLDANHLTEWVEVFPFGLSDADSEAEISILESTATLHPVPHGQSSNEQITTEHIRLRSLDEMAEQHGIDGADFVKVDIDGHEPKFLEGGTEFLKRHLPMLMIEFNQGHLTIAGTDVWALRAQLEEFGYRLFSERTRRPYDSEDEFAADCAGPSASVNVWAVRRDDRRRSLVG